MLEVLWPILTLGFAPFAFVAVLVALPPEPRASDLWIGVVMRGTMRATDDGHVFILFAHARNYEVTFDGPLPDTVCDGSDVAVYGEIDDSRKRLLATSVIGFNNGRYDPCWKSRCLPDQARPPRCLRFE